MGKFKKIAFVSILASAFASSAFAADRNILLTAVSTSVSWSVGGPATLPSIFAISEAINPAQTTYIATPPFTISTVLGNKAQLGVSPIFQTVTFSPPGGGASSTNTFIGGVLQGGYYLTGGYSDAFFITAGIGFITQTTNFPAAVGNTNGVVWNAGIGKRVQLAEGALWEPTVRYLGNSVTNSFNAISIEPLTFTLAF